MPEHRTVNGPAPAEAPDRPGGPRAAGVLQGVEVPVGVETPGAAEWGSDIPAAMLREFGIEYVALNPGASYRGLHDSLVNHLGNARPSMLLCLHEDHVVAIAHGYAKVTDRPMAAVLHSNVGLMHGLMGIFNAWCDRAPVLLLGATGPVEREKRRPWIDWIHTVKDQGALLRDYVKWDDEPRSASGLAEAMLRGHQMAQAEPRGPVYICLDAGLQEQRLEAPFVPPPAARFAPPPPPHAGAESIAELSELLSGARRPVLLFGRGSRRPEDWANRVRLAEALGARVLTSIRERAAFPTDHPQHAAPPFLWLPRGAAELIAEADVVASFDFPDLSGCLEQATRPTARLPATVAHVSLDATLHRGWSMDYFGLAPVDLPIMASPDAVVGQLLSTDLAGNRPYSTSGQAAGDAAPTLPAYQTAPGEDIAPRDIEVALARLRGDRAMTLAQVTLGWSGDVYHFRDPLDYLGYDGGAGLGGGTGITIGAALALRDSGRTVVSVLGDGDFLQGATALWTAARYRLPALFIVSNNRSNFNDELHQKAVAETRGRPVENHWIGQRIEEPAPDMAMLARAQGVQAEGPIHAIDDLEPALRRALNRVAEGYPYLLDVHVARKYQNPPLERGK